MARLLDDAEKRRVEARVRQLRPDSVRQWGRMTPHQAICHLNDSFKIALNERPVAAAAVSVGRSSGSSRCSCRCRGPGAGSERVPEVEQGVGGTPPGEFEQDRDELLALMARFCSAAAEQYCPTHPIFGRMTAGHWRRWAYLHMDHHLRQFGV